MILSSLAVHPKSTHRYLAISQVQSKSNPIWMAETIRPTEKGAPVKMGSHILNVVPIKEMVIVAAYTK